MGKPYIKISYRVDNNTGVLLGCYRQVQDVNNIMCYNGEAHIDMALDYILHETRAATFDEYKEMDIYLSQWFRPDAIVKPIKMLDEVYHPKYTGEGHKKWA